MTMHYAFGEYTLDLQRYELRRSGRPIKLRPKVFQLLAYLIAQRHRVVPKPELLEHLWPDQSVGDAGLLTCIRAVRQAVGDSGQAQCVIATVHGLGYRFVAPVQSQAIHDDAASTTPSGLDAPVAVPMRARVDTIAPAYMPGSDPQHCRVCQHPHSLEAMFCIACGTQLAQLCAGCAQRVVLPATFCPRCGQPLESQPQPTRPSSLVERGNLMSYDLQGEHKSVTVLCGTVAETLALETRLGLETMYHLMQAFATLVQDVVRHYGGTLTHLADEGFTALFGAPVAQEDHAQRAVLAALALQQRLHELPGAPAPAPGVTFTLRVGLHTGSIVVGRAPHDPHQFYTALSETTRLALQVQRATVPGTICLSEATKQLVQATVEVAVDDRDATTVSVPVYIVKGMAQPHRAQPRRAPGVLSRFTGRERELLLLHERLAQVAMGQGQVIGIAGEPGLGKSRLLYEFSSHLQGQPVLYREGRCLAYSSATPYGPVRESSANTVGSLTL
jgi:DNA-binding winged helix-turn-helix (wHTH) protein/class 3 adenylate cyclase